VPQKFAIEGHGPIWPHTPNKPQLPMEFITIIHALHVCYTTPAIGALGSAPPPAVALCPAPVGGVHAKLLQNGTHLADPPHAGPSCSVRGKCQIAPLLGVSV